MNKVILVGHVGKDPEIKDVREGVKLCKFSVATSKKVKGEQKTQWHNCITWNKTAEIAHQYLTKGKQVLIEGEIEYSQSEINGEKKYFTNINVTSLEFLGKKEEGSSPDNAPFEQEQKSFNHKISDNEFQDVPF